MKEQDTIKLLRECDAGVKMGVSSIDDVLEKVEEAEQEILQLPEPNSPDDDQAVAAIEAAKETFDALSEHGKSIVGSDAKAKLEALLTAISDYQITEGDNTKWKKGDSSLKNKLFR